MSEMIFKPKKASILVPGYGVIKREDFEPIHAKAIFASTPVDRDKIIKQHFDVVSYGDLPIFEEEEKEQKEKPAEKKKKLTKKEQEEADLLAEMEAEEKANKKEKEGE